MDIARPWGAGEIRMPQDVGGRVTGTVKGKGVVVFGADELDRYIRFPIHHLVECKRCLVRPALEGPLDRRKLTLFVNAGEGVGQPPGQLGSVPATCRSKADQVGRLVGQLVVAGDDKGCARCADRKPCLSRWIDHARAVVTDKAVRTFDHGARVHCATDAEHERQASQHPYNERAGR